MPTDQRQFVEETLRSSKIRFHEAATVFSLREITESLASDILRYVVEVDVKAFEKFVTSVYGLSI